MICEKGNCCLRVMRSAQQEELSNAVCFCMFNIGIGLGLFGLVVHVKPEF
jgi:hypothetical protein